MQANKNIHSKNPYTSINLSKYRDNHSESSVQPHKPYQPKLLEYMITSQQNIQDVSQGSSSSQDISYDEDSIDDEQNNQPQPTTKTQVIKKGPIQVQYNTLNLSDQSLIQEQNAKLISQYKAIKESYEIKISRLQTEKHALQKKNVELQDKYKILKAKTQACEFQYHHQLDTLHKKLARAEEKIVMAKKNHKNLEEKLLKVREKQNLNMQNNNKECQTQVYDKISKYLKIITEQFLDEVKQNRMNPKVQQSIQKFLIELNSLNPRIVQRISHKHCRRTSLDMDSLSNCQALTPTSNKAKQNKEEEEMKKTYYNKPLPYDNRQNTSMNRQPLQRFNSNHQVSEDFTKLEKSIDKLRQLQKSQTRLKNYQSNQSLDRSSVMNVDRSKSRRKKIFG